MTEIQSDSSDSDILEAFKDSKQEGLMALQNKYWGKIFKVGYENFEDANVARKFANKTLKKVYNFLENINGVSIDLKSVIFVITNQVFDVLKNGNGNENLNISDNWFRGNGKVIKNNEVSEKIETKVGTKDTIKSEKEINVELAEKQEKDEMEPGKSEKAEESKEEIQYWNDIKIALGNYAELLGIDPKYISITKVKGKKIILKGNESFLLSFINHIVKEYPKIF